MGKYDVIGQYRCGCIFGPTKVTKRYVRCQIHGEGIQCEYPLPENYEEALSDQSRKEEWLANQQKNSNGYIKCPNCDEFRMCYDGHSGIWQCLACSYREDLG